MVDRPVVHAILLAFTFKCYPVNSDQGTRVRSVLEVHGIDTLTSGAFFFVLPADDCLG